MAIKIKVIGSGAAGNKAAIQLIEDEVLTKECILLVNSTIKDVPEKYKDITITYDEGLGGCGKEINLGKEYCLNALKRKKLDFDKFINPDDDLVVLVNSTEGGTGASAMIIMAKYLSEVIGIPVMPITLTGFEEDGRGLQNTIEVYQSFKEDYIVQNISNKKFLSSGVNKIKAEKLANKEFSDRIRILLGRDLKDSEQNIDDTDLYKIATTEGYMNIYHSELGKIKNNDDLTKLINDLIDSGKSYDTPEKSLKRLAVMMQATEDTLDNLDLSFDNIKNKLGIPYEIFTHIQKCEKDNTEFIYIIASGQKMPLDEIKEVYEKYKEASEKLKSTKAADDFFSEAGGLEGNSEDKSFNMRKNRKTTSVTDFFGEFGIENNKEVKNNKGANPISKY